MGDGVGQRGDAGPDERTGIMRASRSREKRPVRREKRWWEGTVAVRDVPHECGMDHSSGHVAQNP